MQDRNTGDGSYFVTAPYHPLDRAVAGKITINYANPTLGRKIVSLQDDALELGVLDDDRRRLKLSHHPSGLLQFSGEGITSGLDSDGQPKGIGTISWPLVLPTLGPSFGIGFADPLTSGRPSANRPQTVVLRESALEHLRFGDLRGLHITGFYFPPMWREFVRPGELAASGSSIWSTRMRKPRSGSR